MKLRKGVSPIVAVSLLLIVSVLSIVTFETWFGSFYSNLLVNTEVKGNFYDVTLENVIGDTFYVYSEVDNVSISEIKVDSVLCSVTTNTLNSGLNELNISSCLSNVTDNIYEILLVTNSGIYTKSFFKDGVVSSSSILSSFCTDLIGLYHFDNNPAVGENSSLVYEWTGNGNNATCGGTKCPSFDGTLGKFSGSFRHYGVDDSFSIDEFAGTEGVTDLTVSFWVKFLENSDENVYLVTKQRSGFTQWYVGRERSALGYNLFFVIKNQSGTTAGAYSDAAFANDFLWHHIVARYNSTHLQVFGDGVALDSSPPAISGPITTAYNHKICLGTDYTGSFCSSTALFNGTMDEVMIWNKSLSDSEISDLYSLGSALNCN